MLQRIYLVNKKQIPLTLFEISVFTVQRTQAGVLADRTELGTFASLRSVDLLGMAIWLD